MPPILHPGSSISRRRGGASPARFHLRPVMAQPLLPALSLPNGAVLPTRPPPHYPGTTLARWTDGRRQAIISCLHRRQGSQLSQRRGNEHFSKHTEPGGVVSLRVDGNAAVDLRVVRGGDCGAGRDWRCGVFHAVANGLAPAGSAATE